MDKMAVSVTAGNGKAVKGGAKGALMSLFDGKVSTTAAGKKSADQKNNILEGTPAKEQFASIFTQKISKGDVKQTAVGKETDKKEEKQNSTSSEQTAALVAAYQVIAPQMTDKKGVYKISGAEAVAGAGTEQVGAVLGEMGIKRIQFHQTPNNVIIQAKLEKPVQDKGQETNGEEQTEKTQLPGGGKTNAAQAVQVKISENTKPEALNKPTSEAKETKEVKTDKPVTTENIVPKAIEPKDKTEAIRDKGQGFEKAVDNQAGGEKQEVVGGREIKIDKRENNAANVQLPANDLKEKTSGVEQDASVFNVIVNNGGQNINVVRADNIPTGSITAMSAVETQAAGTIATAINRVGEAVTVTLNPPELGKLSIRFEQEGGELIGRVEFENAKVGQELEAAMPRIVQNLQDAGVNVRQIEFVHTGREQGYGEAADKNGFQNSNGGEFEDRRRYSSSEQGTMSGEKAQYDLEEQKPQYAGAGGVNVWI